jgi:hypothetical protein
MTTVVAGAHGELIELIQVLSEPHEHLGLTCTDAPGLLVLHTQNLSTRNLVEALVSLVLILVLKRCNEALKAVLPMSPPILAADL